MRGPVGVGAALAAVWVLCVGGGCSSEPEAAPAAAAPFTWPEGPNPRATISIAGRGQIELELYPELAPKTVANFEKLAAEGFYDGTLFHRVIPGFMIQGGDPASKDADPRNDGYGGPGYLIDDEFNAAPHTRGVLSMANSGKPNTGGSQFFITLDTQPQLDGHHTVFGRVIAGQAVVDAIAEVEIDKHGRFGRPDRPLEPVVVERIAVEPAAG